MKVNELRKIINCLDSKYDNSDVVMFDGAKFSYVESVDVDADRNFIIESDTSWED